jgi:hypothetical protein
MPQKKTLYGEVYHIYIFLYDIEKVTKYDPIFRYFLQTNYLGGKRKTRKYKRKLTMS